MNRYLLQDHLMVTGQQGKYYIPNLIKYACHVNKLRERESERERSEKEGKEKIEASLTSFVKYFSNHQNMTV